MQPPLVARATAGLEHPLATTAEMTGEPGTVVTCPLDRPDATPPLRAQQRTETPVRTRARSSPPIVAPQPHPSTRPQPRARARPGACRHRRRNPPDLQASLLILRLRLVGSGDAGLSAGKPQRQDCDESHPHRVDKLLIKPTAGARPAPPCHPDESLGKAHPKAASHPTSHKQQHDNQAGNNPRQTSPPSLTVTRGARAFPVISLKIAFCV